MTTQTQNVGNGEFSGVELSLDSPVGDTLRAGGHTHARTIRDALQPNLRPIACRRIARSSTERGSRCRSCLTASLELADDR
jgi:hypothetical protein